ncbi:MAG TPA: metallopeptidase family protein [Acidimicrobiia bacterium]|nr:metallopeptidase family protein [Acidimicrobiia bacterium]
MKRHDFEREVDRVIESLPQWVLDEVDNLVVVVEDVPIEEQGDILGVYEGVSLAERGDYWGALPDRIVIFYRPHLALGLSDEELRAEIRKTVLHELGHHLGIDDERLAELGWD